MAKIYSVHQPQYLPWLGYFDKIARSDHFVFLDKVQYKEREFQNRNKIKVKDGWIWLTVPVIGKGKHQQSVQDVQIDNTFPWERQHLGSLRSWYGHAPYAGDYMPFFEEVYARRWERLSDLNVHIALFFAEKLGIKTPCSFESDIGTSTMSTDRIIEIGKKIDADVYLSGAGGHGYLEEEKFTSANIKLVYQEFTHPVYRQQYMAAGTDFLPYMSAVDLLMNEGPQAWKRLGLKGGPE